MNRKLSGTALGTVAVAVAVAVLTQMPTAFADGSHSIAGAPTVRNGVQNFGNLDYTANPDECDSEYYGYWLLPATAGDKVTINWESTSDPGMRLNVFPVGTNDYNVGQTDPAEYYGLNDNDRAQSVFTATRNGSMPLQFEGRTCFDSTAPGPYDFTVYIKHAVVGSIPGMSHLPMHGAVKVGAHTPDGHTIVSGLNATLQVRRGQTPWVSVGTAPVSNSVAKVSYKLPSSYKGSRIHVRAILKGKAYQKAATRSERVQAG